MLLEHIEYIRTLPVAERNRRVLLYAIGITACIVALWLSVLYFGNNAYLKSGTNAMNPAGSKDSSPALFSGFSNAVSGFGQRANGRSIDTTTTEFDVPPPEQGADMQYESTYSPTPTSMAPSRATSSEWVDGQLVTPPTRATSTPTTKEDTTFVESLLQEANP